MREREARIGRCPWSLLAVGAGGLRHSGTSPGRTGRELVTGKGGPHQAPHRRDTRRSSESSRGGRKERAPIMGQLWGIKGKKLLSVIGALLALYPIGQAEAQQVAGCEDGLVATIQILSDTGGPVSGASVVLPDRQQRFITDAEGRLAVDRVCRGVLRISVSHMAFGTKTVEREVSNGSPITIEMEPRAIALEGLTVEVETVIRQLERRREAHGYRSGVLDVAALPPEEVPADIPAYVAARTGHPLTACGPDVPFGEWNCYPYRGGLRAVGVICVDGVRAQGGPATLTAAVQQGDIARLEFYPTNGLMKVYTKAFVLLAAEKPWLLSDAADGC